LTTRKNVTVRLSEDAIAEIDAQAAAAGLSRQEFMLARLLADVELDAPEHGPVGRHTRRDIEALVCAHPMGESLGAVAENLADALDKCTDQMRPSIAKELKAVLVELSRYEMSGEDDDDFDFGAPSVGDAEDSE
jgi:hypothetical protein